MTRGGKSSGTVVVASAVVAANLITSNRGNKEMRYITRSFASNADLEEA